MKLLKVAGATSEIWQVFIQNTTSITGAGLTGLVFNSASLTAYYHRDTDTTATAISLVTMTVGTFTSSGFKEIDATNMPGFYQFCPPNAALATSAKSCAFLLKGAANMAPLPVEVQLSAVNPDSATAFVTSVLLSAGTGTGQLDFTSGVVKANATQILGGTIPAVTTTGVPKVDVQNWTGTAVSAPSTAGVVEANVKNINNISASAVTTVKAVQGLTTADTITTYTGNTPQTGDSFARIGVAGAGLTNIDLPNQTMDIIGNITGNLSGSVGSVTGAVGSVTAAVAITSNVKKNQALAAFAFLMTDSTNHNPSTGLAVTVTRSINGGAFAAGTLSAVTEVASGIYTVDFGAGDLNGNVIVLKATAAASDTTFERLETQP